LWRRLVSQDQELGWGGASSRLEEQARAVRARTVCEDGACSGLGGTNKTGVNSMRRHRRREERDDNGL
jgi:hypothetical protein